ncbi:MAG: hypothetical protein AAGC55_28095, partial [Myxococcota bacterium]
DTRDRPRKGRDRPRRGGASYTHPSLGYSLDLPRGFEQAASMSPQIQQFQGIYRDVPTVIMIAQVDENPDELGTREIMRLFAQAEQQGIIGRLIKTETRRIQGERRVVGVADDATGTLRVEMTALPCAGQGIVVMVGAMSAQFEQTRSFRRRLFNRYLSLPQGN